MSDVDIRRFTVVTLASLARAQGQTQAADTLLALRTALDDAEADLAEMTRRRDEWKAKAEGYDDVRLALRDAIAGKFGEEGPRTMSRVMWAGVAADEKRRADDAEARLAQADAYKASAVEAERDIDGDWADFMRSAIRESNRAMQKFPQPTYVISKVAEEAGEVVKAAIHCAEGRETAANVRGEMRQLIAMLYRLWVEGDQVHGLPAIRARGGV